ncbi:hypothetical protein [Thermomonospora umbrina]|nr:hypothetical protein [Thermomonospora umbrina]
MGLFRRRKQDPTSLVDRFEKGATPADTALKAGVEAVADGHLAAGVVLLGETRQDPELRSCRMGALADAAIGRSRQIADLAALESHNPDLWAWLGDTIVLEAWAIRGGGYASTVGTDRFKVFWSTLESAYEPLMRAVKLFPEDAAPWETLMWFGLGMQRERETLDGYWEELTARCPTLWMGHWARLQTVSAKWTGSHDEMFAFARDTAERAPRGSLLTGMVPLAHFEFWLSEERRLIDAGRGAMALVKEEVRRFGGEHLAEVKAADDKWRRDMRPHLYDIGAHHLFGGFYARNIMDDDAEERARWHLSRVGNRVAAAPWDYDGGDPVENFIKVLQKLRLPLP